MRWEQHWFTAPLRLRSILRRRAVERELEEELQFHLEHKIEEGVAKGLSPEEAGYAALRAMEGLEQRKEEMRDMRHIHWLTDFVDDTRYAVHSLRRTPGFIALVTITLALGIGLVSAIISILDGTMFRPYPVPHSSAVVTLVSTTHDDAFGRFSYREYLDLCGKTKSYDGVIANASMEAVGFSPDARTTPRIKGGMLVSGNYFELLGVKPQLGRGFRKDEDTVPGRNAVVVLGPAFWKREFASDPSVPGKQIRLNGVEFTVIGVAPESFSGMDIFWHPDFYMPLGMARVFATNRQKDFFEDRDDRELEVSARLKRGVTMQEAQNELAVLAKDLEREYPKVNRGRGAAVHTHFEMRTRDDDVNWRFAVIFAVLGLAILLVACTNVAGLLLSRARARTREIAVRLAIGAGRFRIIRLLLTESLVLACLGGSAGIGVAYAFFAWFHTYQSVIFMTDLPGTIPFRMDMRVLVVSLLVTMVSALLCGLAPALQATRTDLVNGLKTADAEVPGRKRLWGRDALVVAQVAISLMLLTACLLMERSFEHSALGITGFAKDHLLMTSFDPRLVQYNAAETQRFYKLLRERVRGISGVRGEALTENIPLGSDGLDGIAFVPEGVDMPRDRENVSASLDTVDTGYFKTMEIPILHGRSFLGSDSADAPRVAIVNEQFAKHYWPDSGAVGKRIHLESRSGPPVEIVGVAQTIRYLSTTEAPMDFVYLPLAQHPVPKMVLLLRSSGGNPLQFIDPVKDVVRALDPNLPLLDTRSYDEYYRNQAVEGPRTAVKLIGLMGTAGLLMTIAGLYGLVAYNVNRRTREIGIRIAIGASNGDVLRLIMRQGVVLVGFGTALGIAMGFGVEQFLNAMLFNAGEVDLVAYAIVVPAMMMVTLLAAYVPARRASRIAPTQALRYE